MFSSGKIKKLRNNNQTLINLTAQIFSFGLNLIISFFLGRYVAEKIGSNVYGFVNLANTFTSYIAVITIVINGMAARYITVSLVSKDIESANKYFSSVVLTNCGIAAVLIVPLTVFVCFLEKFLKIPQGFEIDVKILWIFVFYIFIINMMFSAYSVSTFASNRLDLTAMRTMESNIIKVIVLIVLINFFNPHIYYIGISSFICGMYTIILNIYYKRKLTPELVVSRKFFDLKSVKTLVLTGIWNSVNQLNVILMTGLDLLITNLFIGPSDMSLYAYAKTVPAQMSSLIGTISNTFSPKMTILYAKNDQKKFIDATNRAVKICGFLCSVPVVGLIVFGDVFFRLWLRKIPDEEIKEIAVLSVLTVIPYILNVYVSPLFNVNTITCKLKVPVLVNTASGIINIVAVFVLLNVTDWGIYIIASVSSVLMLAKTLLFTPLYAAYVLNAKWTTFFKPLIRGIVSSAAVMAVFILIKVMFNISGLASFICVVLLCAAIGYLISFFVLFDRNDKKELIQKVGRKLSKKDDKQ